MEIASCAVSLLDDIWVRVEHGHGSTFLEAEKSSTRERNLGIWFDIFREKCTGGFNMWRIKLKLLIVHIVLS